MPGESIVTTSFANLHNQPWETKEISVYGAAKAFIKQMKFGADLTHVSIPSIFLLPYSILEFLCVRMSSAFEQLLPLGNEPDPQKRLEGVMRYLIGSGRQEDLLLNHKPCNPVLGEIHKARIDHADGSHTYCFAEQTVHHPPTSAFELYNPQHGVSLSGNMNFGVIFHSNSVTVGTSGGLKVRIRLPDGSEELYLLKEGVPDMLLKNVIFGTKYVYWTGSLHIHCPSTGYHAQMAFGYQESANTINGVIWNDSHSNPDSPTSEEKKQKSSSWGARWARGAMSAAKSTAKFTTGWLASADEDAWIQTIEPLFSLNQVIAKFYGVCGKECHIYPITDDPQKMTGPLEKRERYLLVDPSTLVSNECNIYPSQEVLEPNCSLKIWGEFGTAIVADDLERADILKTTIENKQREERRLRQERNEEFVPEHFILDSTDGWDFWTIINRRWYENDHSNLSVE